MTALRLIACNPAPPAPDQVATTWQRSLTRLRTMKAEIHQFKMFAGPIGEAAIGRASGKGIRRKLDEAYRLEDNTFCKSYRRGRRAKGRSS